MYVLLIRKLKERIKGFQSGKGSWVVFIVGNLRQTVIYRKLVRPCKDTDRDWQTPVIIFTSCAQNPRYFATATS